MVDLDTTVCGGAVYFQGTTRLKDTEHPVYRNLADMSSVALSWQSLDYYRTHGNSKRVLQYCALRTRVSLFPRKFLSAAAIGRPCIDKALLERDVDTAVEIGGAPWSVYYTMGWAGDLPNTAVNFWTMPSHRAYLFSHEAVPVAYIEVSFTAKSDESWTHCQPIINDVPVVERGSNVGPYACAFSGTFTTAGMYTDLAVLGVSLYASPLPSCMAVYNGGY